MNTGAGFMTWRERYLQALIVVLAMLLPTVIAADSLLDEGLREFEQLRLRQLQTVQVDGELESFTSDGCSGNLSSNWGLLADGLPGFADEFGDKPPWENCCVAHDKRYWRGGAVDGYSRRLEADQALRQCVVTTGETLAPQLSREHALTQQQVGEAFKIIADLMYRAVRLGGQPCSLLPWRWGYGWPNCAFAALADRSGDYSDIKPDENLVFFDTAAGLDADAKHWLVPIHAWVYEPEDSEVRLGAMAALLEASYALQLTPDSEPYFARRANLLIADNERDKRLLLRVAGRDVELPLSQENGHVYAELKLPLERVNAFAEDGRLHFFALTRAGESRRFEGDVQLLQPTGLGLISDIDDTVKITGVSSRRRLFENTLFRPFRAVDGMAQLYRRLADNGVSLHFVSSSPWQLYAPLREFLQAAGFPRAPMHLKALRFRDESLLDLFRPGTETKPEQIEPILNRFPGRRFILVGDNGEQDPEVYGSIARAYPAQVVKILIRNLDDSEADAARYQAAFRGLSRDLWQLFVSADELAASALLLGE